MNGAAGLKTGRNEHDTACSLQPSHEAVAFIPLRARLLLAISARQQSHNLGLNLWL